MTLGNPMAPLPQLTTKAIVLGIVLSMVLAGANAYLARVAANSLWIARRQVQMGPALEAAEQLRLLAQDAKTLGIIDEVVPEPAGGAHRRPEVAAASLRGSTRRRGASPVAAPARGCPRCHRR